MMSFDRCVFPMKPPSKSRIRTFLHPKASPITAVNASLSLSQLQATTHLFFVTVDQICFAWNALSGTVHSWLQSYILQFNQPWVENIQKKSPESSKKQSLNLLDPGSYFHSIYNYLHSIYIVLGTTSNPGMI